MKKIITLILLSILVFSVVPNKSYALSCAAPLEPSISFANADTVLIGTVTDSKEGSSIKKDLSDYGLILSVDVLEVLKGDFSEKVEIRENITWTTSTIGNTYLFYLNNVGSELVNPLCSATTSDLNEKEMLNINNVTFTGNLNEEDSATIEVTSTVEESKEDNNSENRSPFIYVLSFALGCLIVSVSTVEIFKRKSRNK